VEGKKMSRFRLVNFDQKRPRRKVRKGEEGKGNLVCLLDRLDEGATLVAELLALVVVVVVAVVVLVAVDVVLLVGGCFGGVGGVVLCFFATAG